MRVSAWVCSRAPATPCVRLCAHSHAHSHIKLCVWAVCMVVPSCMASFHRLSETSSLRHQATMPAAPSPDTLPDEKERGLKIMEDPRVPEAIKAELARRIDKQGPFDIRCVEWRD